MASLAYFLYLFIGHPPGPEKETILTGIGEVFGSIGSWLFIIIYGRTLLKLSIGKGSISQRVIPEFAYAQAQPILKRFIIFLNRTHSLVGTLAVAVIILHVAMVGLNAKILFFPLVLALVLWQGLFGLFIIWRHGSKKLRKFSYLVHAQLVTGFMIGIFALFGHLLVEG